MDGRIQGSRPREDSIAALGHPLDPEDIYMTSTSEPPVQEAIDNLAARQQTWAIRVEKEYHKFSAAHFLIFDDGSAERLHGHNYRVGVEIGARRERHGMVVDFKQIKPLIGDILERLDERLLIPGLHPTLTCDHDDNGEVTIRYLDRRYVVPELDVVVLPITNTSSENLAHWIAVSLAEAVRVRFPSLGLRSLEVSVEETPGQRGIMTLEF